MTAISKHYVASHNKRTGSVFKAVTHNRDHYYNNNYLYPMDGEKSSICTYTYMYKQSA